MDGWMNEIYIWRRNNAEGITALRSTRCWTDFSRFSAARARITIRNSVEKSELRFNRPSVRTQQVPEIVCLVVGAYCCCCCCCCCFYYSTVIVVGVLCCLLPWLASHFPMERDCFSGSSQITKLDPTGA